MLCSNPFFKSTVGISKKNWESAIPFGCGQCLACRINQARIWTHRLMLEKEGSRDSAFVTLTYNDDFKPPGNLLCRPDLQKYLKRVRKDHEPYKIRYFAVGEYGNYPTYRPHYHLALFTDKMLNHNSVIEKWSCPTTGNSYGFTSVSNIEKESATYLAGYCIKKLTARHDPFIDILSDHSPEFTSMSRQDGGIGITGIKQLAKKLKKNKWFDKKLVKNHLMRGGKIYPLGRYLYSKLVEELGVDHRHIGQQFFDYQQQLYEEHKDQLDTPGGFISSIYHKDDQKRLSQLKKHKIFKQRRPI